MICSRGIPVGDRSRQDVGQRAFVRARRLVRPRDYPLRGWSRERIAEALAASGFALVEDAPRVGDVALIALAAGQFHLGLMGQTTFVHAHAGLRRVVETPLDAMVMAAPRWRLARKD